MAGGRSAILTIKIIADVQKALAGFKEASGGLAGIQKTADSMAIPAGAALGALALLGAGAASAASDVEQSFGAVESVFKDQADAAKALARSASRDVGLAASDYAQIAAVLGAQLKGMGTASDDLVPATDQLIDLGADLAATYGGTTADAVAAISSLLRGERDPIEKYGVAIKQVDVNAALAERGLDKLTGSAKTQADAQATLELLLGKTTDAQGAFARESDTAAHAQQVTAASIEDTQAALGEALLPVIVLVNQALQGLAQWAQENTQIVQALAIVVGVLAGGVLAISAAIRIWQAATAAYTAVQWLLNAAMSANPIGIIIIAITALIGLFVLLWMRSETFRRIVTRVFDLVAAQIGWFVDLVTGLFKGLVDILQGPFKAIQTAVQLLATILPPIMGRIGDILAKPFKLLQEVVGAVMSAIRGIIQRAADFIGGIFKGLQDAIGGIMDAISHIPKLPSLGSSTPAAAGRSIPGLRGASGRAASSAPITVNVYTTGDSLQAEQAVLRALRRQTRINAGVVPAFGWSGSS